MSTDATEAWRRWYPIAREKARRVLGCRDEADDVAQEAFVRLWRAGLCGGEPRRASAWLYRTTNHLAIDRLRSQRRGEMAAGGADGTADPGGGADELLAARRELARLAAELPADELEVAILHRLDRLGQAEIAQVVGISERTVRRLLRRLEARLPKLRPEEG